MKTNKKLPKAQFGAIFKMIKGAGKGIKTGYRSYKIAKATEKANKLKKAAALEKANRAAATKAANVKKAAAEKAAAEKAANAQKAGTKTTKKPTEKPTVKPAGEKVKFIDKTISVRGTAKKTGRVIKKAWQYGKNYGLPIGITAAIVGGLQRRDNDLDPIPPKINKKSTKKKSNKNQSTKKKPTNKTIDRQKFIRMEIDSLKKNINKVDDFPNV